MTNSPPLASRHAANIISAARILVPTLISGERVTRRNINDAMSEAYGARNSDGAWTQRDSFVALEVATILALQSQPVSPDATQAVAALAQFTRQVPTQTVRSEEQIALQHFSTPPVLAWLSACLAKIGSNDFVLEPSAGTGMLAVWASQAETRHLNEIDPTRAQILRTLFPDSTITQIDAAQIGHIGLTPSVVLMNPPFARNAAGGEDHLAAARHLAAAISTLRSGGRLVAIMPESFANQGRSRDVFSRALRGCDVSAHFHIRNAFKLHGTSIGIRLLVADKILGRIDTEVVSCDQLIEMLPSLPSLANRAPCPKSGHPTDRALSKLTANSSSFSAFKTSRIALPPKVAQPLPADPQGWVDLSYSVIDGLASNGQSTGVYTPWRSNRICIEGAVDHPAALVESAAMASVYLPLPSVVPRLPASIVAKGILSAAQLETVIHALDAHEQDLLGRYVAPEKGLDLESNAAGHIYRQGFFLGDGTGAGKGRQLAGLVMDQWLRGNRRHIWLSENTALQCDAVRDWEALGGMAPDIQPISRFKPEGKISLQQGILFVSYATLRSAGGGRTRLQQILDWCGPDYDGLILFDEAHAMGGVAGGEGRFGTTKGSQQGLAGVELQNRLPRARVVYASATGATDINNLAYAVRLGLWGEGTQFPNRRSFTERIREGGIAAMELVARELKAMGVYTARSLSYDGIEYDILEHGLTEPQIQDFDSYSEAWTIIHNNMSEALEASGVVDRVSGQTLNGQALSAARSRFESSRQRFFGQLLLSMKLPTLLPAIQTALDEGMSAVIQLVSTSEALLTRRLAALNDDERAELSIDLSPRQAMLAYLEQAFPTRAMEIFYDDEGNQRSQPLSDAEGNPVHCPTATRIRDEMIELLAALPPILPALDAIINRFGVEAVAEVTGRTRRLLTMPDGSQKIQSRSASAGVADANLFMAGKKRVLVFSDAGGTGRSYHASLVAQNQERRVHFLLEPGWRADKAIQGLGRTNRTHQASAPIFRPVTTDCRGERRFISTIARRLDALGALTRGQRQTGGQNLFDPADNLESDYAREALQMWYRLLHGGKLTSTGFEAFCERTGLRLEQDGALLEDLPPIQRWLNRILALPIAMQNAIFDEFLGLVQSRIEAARKAGTFDAGVETLVADRLTIVEERDLLKDRSGTITQLLTIEAQWAAKITSYEEIDGRRERAGAAARLMRNSKSGKFALFVPDRPWLDDDGDAIAVWKVFRQGRTGYMPQGDLDESHWADIGSEAFEAGWRAEAVEAANKPHIERFFLATGRLLPIWNMLGAAAQVRRVVTQGGRSLLGRIVTPEAVNSLLSKLGAGDSIKLSTSQIIDAALAGNVVPISGLQGLSVKRSRVNGEQRLEVLGFDPRALPAYKAKGLFTEIIQFQCRLFVPVNQAARILGELAA